MTNSVIIVIIVTERYDTMIKMTQLSHYFIAQAIKKKHLIAADFTCGSGEDTIYLASFDEIETLYSFDIQLEAIEQAKQKNNLPKTHYICDGHEHMDQYLNGFDIGIFNFGYFPSGNHQITTMLETSIIAVKKALQLLHKKGVLLLVLYPGHDEGQKEAQYFEHFCNELPAHQFMIMKSQMMNRPTAPYIIMIEKIR